MRFIKFIKEKKSSLIFNITLLIVVNIYLLSINSFQDKNNDILYLDALIALLISVYYFLEYIKWKNAFKKLAELDKEQDIEKIELGTEYASFEKILKEIVYTRENRFLKENKKNEENLKEIEEYISKWVHEIKLPIAALKIIAERMEDIDERNDIKNQVEKINFLVNSVMYGSRSTSAEEDIFIKKENLAQLVKKAVKNNAFFLIKNNIQIKLSNLDYNIYSDGKWIIYVMDQIINNSIKYLGESGIVEFAAKEDKSTVILSIKDNGIGIAKEDIERIFHKGFTGNNGRNSVYKSTGMGLYFVRKIINKLDHKIEVSSEEGEGTEFRIYFYKLSNHLLIEN